MYGMDQSGADAVVMIVVTRIDLMVMSVVVTAIVVIVVIIIVVMETMMETMMLMIIIIITIGRKSPERKPTQSWPNNKQTDKHEHNHTHSLASNGRHCSLCQCYCIPALPSSSARNRAQQQIARAHAEAVLDRQQANRRAQQAQASRNAVSFMRGTMGLTGRRRISMVQELPMSPEPPSDGDVCGICRELVLSECLVLRNYVSLRDDKNCVSQRAS